MLSGQPLGRTADVRRGGIALRSIATICSICSVERPELLRQLFEGMFRAGTESATAGESLITSR